MQPQSNMMMVLLQFVLIGGIIYFLMIKPERKKQKEHQELLKNLAKNDEVITSGGIHGVVVNVKEKTVVLRLDENCRVEFDKEAVLVMVKKAE